MPSAAMSNQELAALAADPERIGDVEPEALPGLIGEAEALRARLWARLQDASAPGRQEPTPKTRGGADRLLSAVEAAEQLSVTKRWVYRHADTLPFTRRLTGGTLRFSEHGLERWRDSRRAA